MPTTESALGSHPRIAFILHSVSTQCCSFNDINPAGEVEAASRMPFAGPQIIVTHLAFDAARVKAIAAGTGAFLENLGEGSFMKRFVLLREK